MKLSLSESYAIATVLLLLLFTLTNNAIVMLAGSGLGLVTGLILLRREALRRSGLVALVAFAVSLALALFIVLR